MADTEEKQGQSADEQTTAAANWARYEYGRERGHREFCKQARINEGMYLGGGLQWSHEDRQALIEAGKPCFEFNQIMSKINAALGYQIANRMDITYKPRNTQATTDIASTLSKLAMQVADNTGLHWVESQVYADGLIQQRGFFEVMISYQDTMLGEIRITDLDPMDVIPDPDAKGYDPDTWSDVIITKWLTYNEIEALYGTEARQKLEQESPDEEDHGDDTVDEQRNKFGDTNTGFNDRMGEMSMSDGSRRVRIVDRQYWKMTQTECIITDTGDIRVIEGIPDQRIQAMIDAGGVRTKRRMKRVRWTVSTMNHVLHDDWSLFNHFTVVPFFPFFRRGVTRGLVDNAIGPQQMLNKTMNQFLHVTNTTANSGWITWANTLNNMRTDELEDRGAETGLHIELKKDTPTDKMPRKIQPNQVPTGLDRIVERSVVLLDQATGINEAMVGQRGPETSGIAIQSRQHAAQQQLAVPLDNLAKTRNLVASRCLELIQTFYDEPRILRITEADARGREEETELPINWPQGSEILNDMTIGEYSVVISEQPMQVTFENSQFVQCLELLEKGAPIPWPFVLRYSSLGHKQELLDAMEEMAQTNPMEEAKVAEIQAKTTKILSESVNKAVGSMYSATQAANVLATTPGTSGLADSLLRSAGFQDQDAAPIVPDYNGMAPTADFAPVNYDPMTPASPNVGLSEGIRTPETDGVI